MKFLWQQLISFLVLILVILAVISYRMENYLTTQITNDLEEQLINYGDNIINNNFSRKDLEKTTQLLASENILIQVYFSDGRTIYPTYDQRYDAQLNAEELKEIQSGQYLGIRTVQRLNLNGLLEPYLIVYLPHHDVGQYPRGFISLAAPLNIIEKQIKEMHKSILVVLILAMVIGVIISVLTALYQSKKIQKLQALTKEITSGNYDLDVDITGKDEFGDLARDFQKMADALLVSEQEICRQEELRRQFMMDVAHEMRTPLTTMSGMVEGLQYDMIPENQRKRSLELIQRETKRLTRLVNEQLDYQKIISHQFTLKKVKIDGVKLFQSIQEQMSIKAEDKHDTIIVDIEEGLMFWADYDRLVQIIINLISNAIQFSENSEIILSGKMTETHAVVSVKDYGIGIKEEDLKAIWERFYKVDVSRKNTKFGESGIGLSVVKSLVNAHDGEIFVESQFGQGTTFTFKLPHMTDAKVDPEVNDEK